MVLLIFFLLALGIVIYAFLTSPCFSKRKLAFFALSLSFLLSASYFSTAPFTIIHQPGDDSLGAGFLFLFLLMVLLFAYFFIMALATRLRTFFVFCASIPVVMAACYIFFYSLVGFRLNFLLCILADTACLLLCALLIEKAQSIYTKIIAVVLTLLSITVPFILRF